MKRILIILLGLIGVANAQFAPTSSKTKFINGIGIGSKDTSAFSANDTMVVTMARDSVLYYKYKGYWRSIGGSTAAYKLFADTLFTNGYTTRVRDRWGLDSLGAFKVNYTDTAAMLARGWLANRSLDTATALQARIQTKQPLLTNPITGTGTSGQVAYWNGTNTQTGSSNLFWDNSNLRLVMNDLRLTATDITSGLKQVSYYPNSGTNVGASISAIPRGTGFSSALRAQFSLFNTDFIADATNYEFATYRSTSDRFLLASGAAGTGTLRPLVFSSGGVSSPSINAEQFVLFPSGRVGVKTFTDNGVDDMQVNGSLIATTLKATNPLGIAYGGTGSATQNFVDLTTAQTVAGNKTYSGSIISTKTTSPIFTNTAATTNNKYFELLNTGAQLYWGNESSTGAAIVSGAPAYSSYFTTGNATDLVLGTNLVSRLTIASTGAITASSLAGTGDRVVVANSSGVLSATTAAPTSGTYTPTVTNFQNAGSITAYASQYTRIGSVVTVSGRAAFSSTNTAGNRVTVEITLPVATGNFTTNQQCAGTAVSETNLDFGVVKARTSNGTALLTFVPVLSNSVYDFYYTFTYSIQ